MDPFVKLVRLLTDFKEQSGEKALITHKKNLSRIKITLIDSTYLYNFKIVVPCP